MPRGQKPGYEDGSTAAEPRYETLGNPPPGVPYQSSDPLPEPPVP